jgi:hypothetical protein
MKTFTIIRIWNSVVKQTKLLTRRHILRNSLLPHQWNCYCFQCLSPKFVRVVAVKKANERRGRNVRSRKRLIERYRKNSRKLKRRTQIKISELTSSLDMHCFEKHHTTNSVFHNSGLWGLQQWFANPLGVQRTTVCRETWIKAYFVSISFHGGFMK